MIDKGKFATGMGLLAGAFNRTVDGAVSRAYYSILSNALTTDEFEAAVGKVMAEETFWPSPAKLIAAVRSSPADAGAAALEHVNRVLSDHGGYRFLPHEKFHSEFDAPTRAAIAAVGGLADIADTPIERHPALVKKFSSAYAAALQPKLPTPPLDPRVKQLVGNLASRIGGQDRRLGRDA